jgi:hypothetical protein
MRGKVIGGGLGEPAGYIDRRFLPNPEVIGPPECPIMHRWTLIGRHTPGEATKVSGTGRARRKVLLHHFMPGANDRAEHDHPCDFVTVVLFGHYDDVSPCPHCLGTQRRADRRCPYCRDGTRVERMRPGKIRRRRAEHRHTTQVGPKGCWTLVIMGPKRRAWGFWKDGRWYPWRLHERLFGYGMRCPTDGDS